MVVKAGWNAKAKVKESNLVAEVAAGGEDRFGRQAFPGKGAGLRSRSTENKALIVSEVEKKVWPAIVAGKVKPVVYKYLPLSEAAEGHQLMESSKHIGKILLVS
ncbi:hypothetical protein F0562_018444 [Nyssa sinensis]|uniref:Quinone oxidoreductase PIG3 n=1 Tax=Nyssa sinensis TaxID=561372 RepID=A0A5J4ZC86_9ASTE|nr:hypothetical protein F0562_018444 [Nyssa sinensis]